MNGVGAAVATFTVERLMREMGIEGVVRGRRSRPTCQGTTQSARWAWWNLTSRWTGQTSYVRATLTYVATKGGFVHVAFVLDALNCCIVGWGASDSFRSDLALDAQAQSIWERQEASTDGLIPRSDRKLPYLSIRCTERLAEAAIEPSVGRPGDSYDKALAETSIGLYKKDMIGRRGPRRRPDVDLATRGAYDGSTTAACSA